MLTRWIWILATAALLFLWVALKYASPYFPDVFGLRSASGAPFSLLVVPEQAPDDIKPLVMRGFQILLETKKNLPEYAGDRLSCTNCHFSCGNTLGGEQEGFSLVGVVKAYPKKLADDSLYTLPERINSCFLKSTNGKALPIDSEPMKAIVAYLEWISYNVMSMPKQPWLGVKKLRSAHTANVNQGEKIYASKCALCHGNDGNGQQRENDLSYPPLWGEHSFNDAAGMNQLSTMASFIYYNMPYHEPGLTIEEALDTASYVISKPRPHFTPQ